MKQIVLEQLHVEDLGYSDSEGKVSGEEIIRDIIEQGSELAAKRKSREQEIKGRKQEKDRVLRETGRQLMCRIAALLPEESHGVYLGDPSISIYQLENRFLPEAIGRRTPKK